MLHELAVPYGMSDVTGLDLLDRLVEPQDRTVKVRDRIEWARAAGGEVR